MPLIPVTKYVAAALILTAAATIYLGVLPGDVLGLATRGAHDLLR
jgi:hypothetical protein